MDDAELSLRRELIRAHKGMNASGLNQGTSGNISVRFGDGMLIGPSGVPYDDMAPDDVCFVAMDGSCDHRLAPSSEWRFHRDILKKREEVNAVVHAHPTYATALAMCRKEIPAAHYMVAAAGGPSVRCAEYATYGTAELSKAALKALKNRTCCLLANHGIIATGPSLAKAMWLAVELETLARQYVVALGIKGGPVILDDDEIAKNVEKFKSYGLKAKG